MLSSQIYDLMDSTQAAIAQAAPADVQAVRNCPPLVQFSPAMQQETAQLKAFLFASLYRHPRVLETMDKARQVVGDLFAAYVNDPAAMQAGADAGAPQAQSTRRVADYIAGMTDRFASREHQRLTGRVLLA
jgi:dGTPase